MTKNTRRFELRLGRVGLTIFLLGVSGLLFVFFLLGVTVGKNIDAYPERVARFLPERIKILASRLSQEATEPAVAVREDLKREKPEPAAGDGPLRRDADQMREAPEGAAVKQETAAAVQAPMRQTVHPPETKSEAPAPAVQAARPVKEKTAPPGKVIVQVVSYKDERKAEALVRTIAAMGYSARTEVTELPDRGRWFRVVMGEFAGRPEAQAAIDALSKKARGLNCVIRSADSAGN